MLPTDTRLSYLELLSVSWLIAWRYLALAVIFGWIGAPVLRLGVVGILASLQIPDQVVLTTAQILAVITPILLFYPLVVQMALTKEFREFEIQAVREDGSPDALSFRESLKPGLYFAVLTFLIALPVGIGMAVVLAMVGYPPWVQQMGGIPWSLLAAYPIAVRLMLKKRYRSFQFEVTRGGGTTPIMEASSPAPSADANESGL